MGDTLWGTLEDGGLPHCSPARWDHESGLPSHLSRCQKELGILFVFPAPSHFHTHPGSGLPPVSPALSQWAPNLPPIHSHRAFPGHCPNGCLVMCLKTRSWHTTPWLNPALAPQNLSKFLSVIFKTLPILSGLLIHPKAHSLSLNLRTCVSRPRSHCSLSPKSSHRT